MPTTHPIDVLAAAIRGADCLTAARSAEVAAAALTDRRIISGAVTALAGSVVGEDHNTIYWRTVARIVLGSVAEPTTYRQRTVGAAVEDLAGRGVERDYALRIAAAAASKVSARHRVGGAAAVQELADTGTAYGQAGRVMDESMATMTFVSLIGSIAADLELSDEEWVRDRGHIAAAVTAAAQAAVREG